MIDMVHKMIAEGYVTFDIAKDLKTPAIASGRIVHAFVVLRCPSISRLGLFLTKESGSRLTS
jgi:hypothetical protein